MNYILLYFVIGFFISVLHFVFSKDLETLGDLLTILFWMTSFWPFYLIYSSFDLFLSINFSKIWNIKLKK